MVVMVKGRSIFYRNRENNINIYNLKIMN